MRQFNRTFWKMFNLHAGIIDLDEDNFVHTGTYKSMQIYFFIEIWNDPLNEDACIQTPGLKYFIPIYDKYDKYITKKGFHWKITGF